MTAVRVSCWCVLLVLAGATVSATAGGPADLAGCAGLELSLGGADHSHWVKVDHGRLLLSRHCVPAGEECDHDVLVVWDQDGRQLLEAAPYLDLPQMTDGHILDAALCTPDRLVVSAVVGRTEFHAILAEYDVASGELLHVASTGSTWCLRLHGDDDGVTWCLGADVAKRSADQDFDLVYRFDASGTLLGSSLPRSTFFPRSRGLLSVRSAGRGEGFLPGDGEVRLWLPAAGELVSFDGEGAVAARLPVAEAAGLDRGRPVFSPSGDVLTLLEESGEGEADERAQVLRRLAPDGSSWEPVAGVPERFPMGVVLIGADDSGLVVLEQSTLRVCRLPIEGGGNAP